MKKKKVKEIVFAQAISADSIKWLIDQCADQKKVIIFLNSGGGETSPVLAFFEYIKLKKIDLHVHVLNACMSAAIIILCAAKKRTAPANARFIIHQMKKFFKDAELMEDELSGQAKDLKMLANAYNEIVSRVTQKPLKRINALCSKQTILSAKQVLDLGLLTEITS